MQATAVLLAGKLNWACRVVYGGRPLLRHILDVMNDMQSSSAKYCLSSELYADLTWWVEFLRLFNGRQMFLDSKPVVDVQTDACFEDMGNSMQVTGFILTFHMSFLHYRTCISLKRKHWLLLWLQSVWHLPTSMS